MQGSAILNKSRVKCSVGHVYVKTLTGYYRDAEMTRAHTVVLVVLQSWVGGHFYFWGAGMFSTGKFA